jgi:predicted MPP superfamily phosphohydrolase
MEVEMQSDFTPMSYNFNEDIKLYAIADLHIGSPECQIERWNGFKKQLLSEPNSRIVIVGDMINNATRSSVSNVF